MKYNYLFSVLAENHIGFQQPDDIVFKIPHAKYKNLVFAGGGVKGTAYAGALHEMENFTYSDGTKLLDHIQVVSGTSAGAINAMMVSLGYTSEELLELAGKDTFQHFADHTHILSIFCRLLSGQSPDINEGKKLHEFIKDLIFKKTGIRNLTFKQLHELKTRDVPVKDLIVTGTNLTTKQVEYYSHQTTPDMKIADAVRISAGIPGYFKSITLADGQERVDGGVIDNFPIQVLDTPLFREKFDIADPCVPYNGANSQTLGFKLNGKPDFNKKSHGFYSQLCSTLLKSYTGNNETYRTNTVSISCWHQQEEISPINMQLSDAKTAQLIINGQAATREHLLKSFGSQNPNLIRFESLHEKYEFLLSSITRRQKVGAPNLTLSDLSSIVRILSQQMAESQPEMRERCRNEIQAFLDTLAKYQLLNQVPDYDSIDKVVLKVEEYAQEKPMISSTSASRQILSTCINQCLNLFDETAAITGLASIESLTIKKQIHALLQAQSHCQISQNWEKLNKRYQEALEKINEIYVSLDLPPVIDQARYFSPCAVCKRHSLFATVALSTVYSPVYSSYLLLKMLTKLLETLINFLIYTQHQIAKQTAKLGLPTTRCVENSNKIKSLIKAIHGFLQDAENQLATAATHDLDQENFFIITAINQLEGLGTPSPKTINFLRKLKLIAPDMHTIPDDNKQSLLTMLKKHLDKNNQQLATIKASCSHLDADQAYQRMAQLLNDLEKFIPKSEQNSFSLKNIESTVGQNSTFEKVEGEHISRLISRLQDPTCSDCNMIALFKENKQFFDNSFDSQNLNSEEMICALSNYQRV